eukprot:151495-Chlamydomonas_euryale.AAC.1
MMTARAPARGSPVLESARVAGGWMYVSQTGLFSTKTGALAARRRLPRLHCANTTRAHARSTHDRDAVAAAGARWIHSVHAPAGLNVGLVGSWVAHAARGRIHPASRWTNRPPEATRYIDYTWQQAPAAAPAGGARRSAQPRGRQAPRGCVDRRANGGGSAASGTG